MEPDITTGDKINNKNIYENREFDVDPTQTEQTQNNSQENTQDTIPHVATPRLKSYVKEDVNLFADEASEGLSDIFGGMSGVQGYGESVYDKEASTLSDFQDLNELRYREQNGITQLAAGFGNMAVKTATSAIGTLLSGAVGLYDYATSDDPNKTFLQSVSKNTLQEVIHDINEWGNKTMPIYQSKNYEKIGTFEKMLTTTFWGNFIDNMGFSSGTILATAVTGGLGTGSVLSSLAARLGASPKASEYIYRVVSSFVGAASESAMMGYDRYLETQKDYSAEVENDYINKRVALENERKNAIIQAIYESNPSLNTENPIRLPEVEAEITNRINAEYDTKLQALENNYKADMQNAEQRALSAGAATTAANQILLTFNNLGGVMSFLKSGMTNANRVAQQSVLDIFRKQGFKKGISNAETKLIAAREAFSEGFEEGEQGWIDNLMTDYYGRDYDPEASDNFARFMTKAGQSFKSTMSDPSTYDEILAGAITGLTGAFAPHREKQDDGSTKMRWMQGGIAEAFREGNKLAEVSQNTFKEMNEIINNKDLRNSTKLAISNLVSAQKQMELAGKGDKKGYLDEQNTQAIKTIQTFANAGKLNDLIALVGDVNDLSDEQLQQMALSLATPDPKNQGKYIPDNDFVDSNGELKIFSSKEDKDKLREKIQKKHNEFKRIINNYRDALNEADRQTGYQLDQDKLNMLAWGFTQVKNWKDRIQDMYKLSEFQEAVQEASKMLTGDIHQGKHALYQLNKELKERENQQKEAEKWQKQYDDTMPQRKLEFEERQKLKKLYAARHEQTALELIDQIDRLEKDIASTENTIKNTYAKGNNTRKQIKGLKEGLSKKYKHLKKLYEQFEKQSQLSEKRNKEGSVVYDEQFDNVVKGYLDAIRQAQNAINVLDTLIEENTKTAAKGKERENEKAELTYASEQAETAKSLLDLTERLNEDTMLESLLNPNGKSTFETLRAVIEHSKLENNKKNRVLELLSDMEKCAKSANVLNEYMQEYATDPSKLDNIIDNVHEQHNQTVKNKVEQELEDSLNEINSGKQNSEEDPWSEEELNGEIELRLGDEESNSIKNMKDSYEKALTNAKRRLKAAMIFNHEKLSPKQIDEKIDKIIKQTVGKIRKNNKNLNSYLIAYELTEQFADLFEEVTNEVSIKGFEDIPQAKRIARELFELANIYAFSHGIHPILLNEDNLVKIFEAAGYSFDDLSHRAALIFVNSIYRHIEEHLNDLVINGKITGVSEPNSKNDTKSIDGSLPTTSALYNPASAIFKKYDEKLIEENPQWRQNNPPTPPTNKKELTKLPAVKPEALDDSVGQKAITEQIDIIYDNQNFTTEEEVGSKTIENFSSAISNIESNVKKGVVLSPAQREVLNTAKQRIKDAGYEIVDLGIKYSDNIKATVTFVEDNTLSEDVCNIDFVNTPQLLKNGVMVQPANIIVKIGKKQVVQDVEYRSAILKLHSKEYDDRAVANKHTLIRDTVNPVANKILDDNGVFDFINSGKLAKLFNDNNGNVPIYASKLTDDKGNIIPDTVFFYVKVRGSFQMIGYIDSFHEYKQSKMSSEILGLSSDDKNGIVVSGFYKLRNEQVVSGVNLEVANIPTYNNIQLLENTSGQPMRLLGIRNGKMFLNNEPSPIGSIPVGNKTLKEAYNTGEAFIIYNGKFIGNTPTEDVDLTQFNTSGIKVMVKNEQDKWELFSVTTENAINLLNKEVYDKTNPLESDNALIKAIKDRVFTWCKEYVKEELRISRSEINKSSEGKRKREQNIFAKLSQIFNPSTKLFYHQGLRLSDRGGKSGLTGTFEYKDTDGSIKEMKHFVAKLNNFGDATFEVWAEGERVIIDQTTGATEPGKPVLITKFTFKNSDISELAASGNTEDAIATYLFDKIYSQLRDENNTSSELLLGFNRNHIQKYEGYMDAMLDSCISNNRSFLRQGNHIVMMYLDKNAEIPDVVGAYEHGNARFTKENANTITIDDTTYALTRRPNETNTGYMPDIIVRKSTATTDLNKGQMVGNEYGDFKKELKSKIDPDNLLTDEEFNQILLQMWSDNQDYNETLDNYTGESKLIHTNSGEIGNKELQHGYTYNINGKTVRYDIDNKRFVLTSQEPDGFYSENGKELVFYRGFSADEFDVDFSKTSQKAVDYAKGIQGWVHASSSLEEANEYADLHVERDKKKKQLAKIRFSKSARVKHFKDVLDYNKQYNNGNINIDEIDVIILDKGTLYDGVSEVIARPSVVKAEPIFYNAKPTKEPVQPPVNPETQQSEKVKEKNGFENGWSDDEISFDDERNNGNFSNANVTLKHGIFNAYLFFRDFIKEQSSLLRDIDRELIDFIMPNIDKRMVVKVLNRTQWKEFKERKALPDNVLGLHSKDGNVIFLPETTDVTTFLHEMSHAATVKYINQLFEQNGLSAPSIEELDKIYQKILDIYNTNPSVLNSIEGTKNFLEKENRLSALKEFAAEGISNKQLQEFMKGIKIKEDEEQQRIDNEAKPSAFKRFVKWIRDRFTSNGISDSKADTIIEYTLFDKFKKNIIDLPTSKEYEINNKKSKTKVIYKAKAIRESNNKDSEITVYDTNLSINTLESEEINTKDFLCKYDENGNWSTKFAQLYNEFTDDTGRLFDMNDSSQYGLTTKRMFFEFLIDKGYKGFDMATGDELTGTKFASTSYLVVFGNNYKTAKQLSEEIEDNKQIMSVVSENTRQEILEC